MDSKQLPAKPWYLQSGKILITCKYVAISEEFDKANVYGVRWKFVGNKNIPQYVAPTGGLDGLLEIKKHIESHGGAVPPEYGRIVTSLNELPDLTHMHPNSKALFNITANGFVNLHGIWGLNTCPRYVSIELEPDTIIDFNRGGSHYSYHIAVKNAIKTLIAYEQK